jgi:hypothetical protein
MLLGILTLITALSISAVAIYYSVAGLMAIFAAAAIPIMIMGGILEVSKLVTAVWLHRYWKQATWWLKTYLTTAVLVLMLITSMGIFGFLSKAHIEQTSATEETVARVETIEKEIERQTAIITRAETKIQQLESSGTSVDTNLQAQIDKEQERIDKAFERIQPAIAQQNKIIDDARASDNTRTKPYEDQLTSIQAEVSRLEQTAREYEDKIATLSADTSAVQPLLEQIDAIEQEIIRVTNQVNSGERDQIRAGQAIIGVTSDGAFGSNTRKALVAWVAAQRERITQIQGEVSKLRVNATSTVNSERDRLAGVVKDIREKQIPALKEREITMLGKIDEVRQTESPAIATARDEIQRLRESAESQVAQSQTLIERLRSQLANTDNTVEIQKSIDEQNERVRTASKEIDTLTEERIALEAEYRKLEAEVGPIKYIAEFVYGDQADKNMLEEAVRWVIITIIFVFDPLAVLLLIASQYTFEYRRKDDSGGWLRQYEQARAQRIVDNPGFTVDDPKEDADENDRRETTEEATQDAEELRDGQEQESVPSETGDDPVMVEEKERSIDDVAKDYITTDDAVGDTVSEADTAVADASDIAVESTEVQVDEEQSVDSKKKNDIELSEELKEARRVEVEEQEQDITWQEAKQQWKLDNPALKLKPFKQLYIDGKIDVLPWEDYVKPTSYIMKENGKQVIKETKPETSEGESQTGYIQNAEQNDNTQWKRLKDSGQ